MRIFGKLIMTTLLTMLITLAVGLLGWHGLSTTRDTLDTVISVRSPQLRSLSGIIELLNTLRIDEFALVNSRLEPDRRVQVREQLQLATEHLDKSRHEFAALPMTDNQKRLWQQADAALDQWQAKHTRMLALVANNRILNIELLPAILAEHRGSYRQWFEALKRSVHEGKRFGGELNPLASGLGRWLATYETDDEELARLLAELRTPLNALHDLAYDVDQLLAAGRSAEARALLDRLGKSRLQDFESALAGILDYIDGRMAAFDVAVNYIFGDVASAFTDANAALHQLSADVTAETISASAEATATGNRSQAIAMVATLLGMLLALGFGLLLTRHMVLRLRGAVGMLKELEQGHLDVRLDLPGVDEIGDMSRAMDAFAADLQQRVRGVNAAGHELGNVAALMAEVSQQVGSVAREQAEEVMETVEAIDEIGASISQIGDNVGTLSAASSNSTSSALEMSASSEELAGNADQLLQITDQVGSAIAEMATSIQQVATNSGVLKESSDATVASVVQMNSNLVEVERAIRDTTGVTENVRRDVDAGRNAVESTIAGIKEVHQSSRISADAIAALSDKVQEIGKVLSMIDEVTDQTRLLALNATILAAQAGQHGKSFAVVAEEIRSLSERTSSSTREITAIIDGVQQETGRVAKAIRRTEQQVDAGEALSRAAGEALVKIVTGIHEVEQRMAQIARATVEQTQGAKVIGTATERVAQMVDQTAAATAEQSSTARTITEATEQMRTLTFQVKTSAREQSDGSRLIATSMAEIDDMVQQINRACGEQIRQRDRIGSAVSDIQQGTEASLDAASLLQKTVEQQNRQIEQLQQQMGAFRIAASETAEKTASPDDDQLETPRTPAAETRKMQRADHRHENARPQTATLSLVANDSNQQS